MNRTGKRCVLYSRVSTEMQVDGYSLEGQKTSLRKFADREEMKIVGEYEDAGKSGKSIEGRPAFKNMLSDIENGLQVDYILVYKLSRFGRNAADILNSMELIKCFDTNLICIEEGIDSSQTSGKLLISVLSAVAEIERENIIEQTMNGRKEKARQGGWNGGFAPYGFYLEDKKLHINEEEAETIRMIFDLYANKNLGFNKIAKTLNLQGIKKITRQNGTLDKWSGHQIRMIIDNPVYAGMIAFGRRKREKIKGTKNEYHMVKTGDYILQNGQHNAIIDEELWNRTCDKRKLTGHKAESKIGKDRAHLLSGILKCPKCGGPMYTNKHAWTNKDGTYKEIYYYVCSRIKLERGVKCDYKAMLKKTDIEPIVIELLKEIVNDKVLAQAMVDGIADKVDTSTIDKELEGLKKQLKEVEANKSRLENEIDTLPLDARYRERKINDMTQRLDGLYDTMADIEECIADANKRKSTADANAINLENIKAILKAFSETYDMLDDYQKRSLISFLIKEIQIYPKDENASVLKSIEFKFPVFYDGEYVRQILWDKDKHVETCVLLSKLKSTHHIEIEFNTDEFDITASESKASYNEIKDYVKEHMNLKVSSLYIAQVKQKCGIKERENYNKPKSDKSRQSKCPKEKEEAIIEALRYFKMI